MTKTKTVQTGVINPTEFEAPDAPATSKLNSRVKDIQARIKTACKGYRTGGTHARVHWDSLCEARMALTNGKCSVPHELVLKREVLQELEGFSTILAKYIVGGVDIVI